MKFYVLSNSKNEYINLNFYYHCTSFKSNNIQESTWFNTREEAEKVLNKYKKIINNIEDFNIYEVLLSESLC